VTASSQGRLGHGPEHRWRVQHSRSKSRLAKGEFRRAHNSPISYDCRGAQWLQISQVVVIGWSIWGIAG
jgi:hypothetical protein